VTEATKLCAASLHPDSGHVLPLIFRPPVYVLLGAPLVVATLVPHPAVTTAFLFQLPFQTYNAGFTIMNGNRSVLEKSQHPLYLSASILYLTCMGAAPALAMKRLGVRSPAVHSFFGKILPAPLYALLGGLSVALMRFSEVERGVQIMDRDGDVVGTSYRAAEKASPAPHRQPPKVMAGMMGHDEAWKELTRGCEARGASESNYMGSMSHCPLVYKLLAPPCCITFNPSPGV
ncbi:sideroflexin-4-like, partial [Phyllobates terribilis]|uniref:sideroflexin-4-like n=1 Tax=Phyllobates terribilis TaxID=111132 RepID=UPI003CCB3B66